MGSQVYPSTAGAGIGSLVYSFQAIPGAEYDTTQLNSTGIYEFRVAEEPVTIAIYKVGDLTTPVRTVRINESDTFTYTGTVARIRILTGTSNPGIASEIGRAHV